MNWAAANGFIVASPVGVVDKLLPKQPGKRERVEHQPALPWRLLPAFFSGVLHAGETNITRHMLELLILTGCRSGLASTYGMAGDRLFQRNLDGAGAANEG